MLFNHNRGTLHKFYIYYTSSTKTLDGIIFGHPTYLKITMFKNYFLH